MEFQEEKIASRRDSLPYPEALSANADAIRELAEAVQGTLGPKGLDTMLVDERGGVVVTNDGVTILKRMEIQHPAARMVAGIARAQQEEVGDGTTTATLLAAALVDEGLKQVNRGVPAAKVIAGIRRGVRYALEQMQDMAQPIWDLEDEWLQRIAFTASREQEDITELVIEAAMLVGRKKLLDKDFRLSDAVVAHPRAESEVFAGLFIPRREMNLKSPEPAPEIRVLPVAGDLRPERVDEGSLSTDAGFAKQEKLKEEFEQLIVKLIDLDVGLIAVEGEVDPQADERLTEAGIRVAHQVNRQDLDRLAEYTGARLLRPTSFNRSREELASLTGRCEQVEDSGRLGWFRVTGGHGKPFATILVSAATEEVVEERERIAKDAAAAVQAAVRGGFLPGGGAVELALARGVEAFGDTVQGMEVYGVSAVAAALHRPMAQMVSNAGFNPLEKVEEVKALQWRQSSSSLGLDCDRGVVSDMVDMGVVDPLPVKYHALQAAGEVSTAILRIHTVVKMRRAEAERLR